MDWIVTSSIIATEGLLHPLILNIWEKCRKGIMIHMEENLTQQGRTEALIKFKQAGKLMERVILFEPLWKNIIYIMLTKYMT